jgi:hypothetical protein
MGGPPPPIGGTPPMVPMGGPGTFPVPQGGNPFAPMPPMPLAGMPPPQPQMAQPQMPQQGSNAPRRRRFGDSLESMMNRNMFAAQQRPLPMPQRPPQMMPQQRMVAPKTPMMRTPTPRPMQMGGIVGGLGPITNDSRTRLGDTQYFDDGGAVNRFDPDTSTYEIGDSSFTMGDTYGEEELPASVAYSKQVQENREAQGLPTNESSAWNLYQKGEHWSQQYQAQDPVEEAEEPIEVIDPVEKIDPVEEVKPVEEVQPSVSYSPVVQQPVVQEPINYDNFTGDIGSITGGYPEGQQTYEMSALYGPKINIPKYESKFVQDPVTNTLTTTAGPTMTAVSPIGAINLPASPIEFNIFDYLVDPVYGSINDDDDVEEFEDGGIVQYFANGGNANAQAAASMMSAGIGNVGGKAITSEAQSVQDSFSDASSRRKRRRRRRKAREEAERLASEQLALESAAQQNNPNIDGPMESALQNYGGTAFQSAATLPPSSDVTPEIFVPEVGAESGFASNFMNIERPDRILDREAALFPDLRDDDPALTQNIIPSEVDPGSQYTYDQGAIGFGDNQDITNPDLGAGADVDQSGVGLPSGIYSPEMIRLNFGMDDKAEFPALPGNREFKPEGTQIAPEAATVTPTENFESTRAMLESNVFDPDKLDPRGDQIVSPTGTGIGQKITPPKAITGVDAQADQYRPSVNAAEAAYLQEALDQQIEYNDEGELVASDPNFLEEVFGKVIKNLTFNMYDPNNPQKKEDAKAILDAYRETGKFVYDGKELSLTELIKASKDEGIQPAVIGVEGADGTVGFDDGTGFRNIMGDYDMGKGIGSDTENILTGSTDIFGGGDNLTDITTTGGDDRSDGPDTGFITDEDGNIICNTEGYVHNPETNMCEPAKEEEEGESSGSPSIDIGKVGPTESFEDIMKRVVVAAPNIAPISANVQPMQEGGMAGLNRAADNFLQALAG